jgi:hypothetical protein
MIYLDKRCLIGQDQPVHLGDNYFLQKERLCLELFILYLRHCCAGGPIPNKLGRGRSGAIGAGAERITSPEA